MLHPECPMGETTLLFELAGADGNFTVRLLVDGHPSPLAEAPFEYEEGSQTALKTQRVEQARIKLDDLKWIGDDLWQRLLAGKSGEYFDANYPLWVREKRTCHVRLRIKPPRLEALPWECLYHKDMGFLSQVLAPVPFSVVRDPTAAPPAPQDLPAPPAPDPLRVLIVIPQGSFLNVETELHNLKRAFEQCRRKTDVEELTGIVSPKTLTDALRDRAYDIVHYIGHGRMDWEQQQTSIRFNREGALNQETWLDGETFATLFAHHPPTLAFLNCCMSGAVSSSDSSPLNLSGLGPYLVGRARAPAVLAMRYEVPDAQAVAFSQTFYRELLGEKQPGRVDRAVAFARQDLYVNRTDSTVRGFITPVLYLAQGREQLFAWGPPADRTAPVPTPPAQPTRRPKPAWRDQLVEALQERRCIPVIGSGIYAGGLARSDRRGYGIRLLARAVADLCPYEALDDELRLCELAGEWLDLDLFQWVCQNYEKLKPDTMFKLWDHLASVRPTTEDVPRELRQFFHRWPDTPGIVCTHFDGVIQDTLRNALQQRVTVIHEIDQKQLALQAGDRVLLNLRGSVESQGSLVLTKEAHDRLWDRVSAINPVIKDHLITGKAGRLFLFLGIHPRDGLVHHFARCLIRSAVPNWCGKSHFVTHRQPTHAEEGYWDPVNVSWIVEDDLLRVLEVLGE
jgi:hypothetical protein